jgi:hypothetical protein
MKTYFQFLVLMLPTAFLIGLASATAVSEDAKPESPSFQLPHVGSDANRSESTKG